MSDELETRVAETLAALPGPSAEVEARARAAALDALPPSRRRAVWPRALLVAAAFAGVLAAGAAALAAIGTIHVGVGRERAQPAAAPSRLLLPRGAKGIAVVAGGKLWLTTRGGTRIEGLPVSSAALSPHALYAAAGIGRSLVVMRPDGRQAWTRATGGTVEAIAWAPSGLRLAYVVRTARGAELRTIEGDGDHDRLLDGSVRPVRPSWRADSLALAYVGAGGHAVVYDLGHRKRRVVDTHLCAGAVSTVAFAPRGRQLALAGRHAVYAAAGAGRPARCVYLGPMQVDGLAWTGSYLVYSVAPGAAVAGARTGLRSLQVSGAGRLVGSGYLPTRAPVHSLAAAAGGRLALAVGGAARDTRLLLVDRPPPWGSSGRSARVRDVLLRLDGPAAIESVAVR